MVHYAFVETFAPVYNDKKSVLKGFVVTCSDKQCYNIFINSDDMTGVSIFREDRKEGAEDKYTPDATEDQIWGLIEELEGGEDLEILYTGDVITTIVVKYYEPEEPKFNLPNNFDDLSVDQKLELLYP